MDPFCQSSTRVKHYSVNKLKDVKGKSWYRDFIQLIQTIFTEHLLRVRQYNCYWLLNHGTIYWERL